MPTVRPFIICSTSAAILFAAGCNKQTSETRSSSDRAKSKEPQTIARSITFSEFAVARKPAVTPELLARGKTVYTQNCAACHGLNGDGKGDAAAFLAPKPRDFVKATIGCAPPGQTICRRMWICSAKFLSAFPAH